MGTTNKHCFVIERFTIWIHPMLTRYGRFLNRPSILAQYINTYRLTYHRRESHFLSFGNFALSNYTALHPSEETRDNAFGLVIPAASGGFSRMDLLLLADLYKCSRAVWEGHQNHSERYSVAPRKGRSDYWEYDPSDLPTCSNFGEGAGNF